MLKNSILRHTKKTFQPIAFESKIKLSQGRSVKRKKVELGSKMFLTRRNGKIFDTSKNDQRHEKVIVQFNIYLRNDNNNLKQLIAEINWNKMI